MPDVWLHFGVDYDYDGRASPFGKPDDKMRLALPVEGGPAFLIGQNFSAVMSYNPARGIREAARVGRRNDQGGRR